MSLIQPLSSNTLERRNTKRWSTSSYDTSVKSMFQSSGKYPILVGTLNADIARGTFIEFRNGMINVSPVGRNAR